MFQAIATGKNENYGKKGQKRLIPDNFFMTAIKNDWIKLQPIKYVGIAARKRSTIQKLQVKEKLVPMKHIDAIETLNRQNNYLKTVDERILTMISINEDFINLLKEKL